MDRNVVPLLELRAASPSLPSRGAWIEMVWRALSMARMAVSLPSRGAWIEIRCNIPPPFGACPSLPSRGAWIEMFVSPGTVEIKMSLPSRGAWIEIRRGRRTPGGTSVAPLTGSVDRNDAGNVQGQPVAAVAPLTGSVDRNVVPLLELRAASPSLPSRGAWIEIDMSSSAALPSRVAPLTGSVDRNSWCGGHPAGCM